MQRIIQSASLVFLCLVGSVASAAPYTNYLSATSNALAAAHASPSNTGRVHRALGLALGALRQPSRSVAGDLSMLSSVNRNVAPLGTSGDGLQLISETLSNALTNFVLEAEAEIAALSNRLAQVTPFQTLRRSASNQLFQAEAALAAASTNATFRGAITSVRLAYVKIADAARLTRRAEANPGPAVETLLGGILTHVQPRNRGVVGFPTADRFAEKDSDGTTGTGIYEYTRTGFASGTLVLHHDDDDTTTVKLHFITASRGTFTYRNVDSDGTNGGSGTFTLAHGPPAGTVPVAVTGLSLRHASVDEDGDLSITNSGTLVFTSATEFTETNPQDAFSGTYEYTLTGSNTATLILHQPGVSTTTVSLVFRTEAEGFYAVISEEVGGETWTEGGTFILGP